MSSIPATKNTNNLKGIKCPKCGYEDHFKVQVKVIATGKDHGAADLDTMYHWNTDNLSMRQM